MTGLIPAENSNNINNKRDFLRKNIKSFSIYNAPISAFKRACDALMAGKKECDSCVKVQCSVFDSPPIWIPHSDGRGCSPCERQRATPTVRSLFSNLGYRSSPWCLTKDTGNNAQLQARGRGGKHRGADGSWRRNIWDLLFLFVCFFFCFQKIALCKKKKIYIYIWLILL